MTKSRPYNGLEKKKRKQVGKRLALLPIINKKRFLRLIVACCFLSLGTAAEADPGWLVNPQRFLFSVHKEFSCQDCHTDISQRARHPDPQSVNRSMTSFFRVGQCADCHDDVLEEIETGSHGGVDAEDAESLVLCIRCHNPHYEGAPTALPEDAAVQNELSEADSDCLACHREPASGDPQGAAQIRALCFTCHASDAEGPAAMPRIDSEGYAQTPHARMLCLVCHPRAAAFDHGRQPRGDCQNCHTRHPERVIHDAHATVSCEACHLGGGMPVRDPGSGIIHWQPLADGRTASALHQMRQKPDAECERCHYPGTPIGASATVLPAKGIMCMPCHTATLSVSDPVSFVSLLIFLLGLIAVNAFWFGGASLAKTSTGRVAVLRHRVVNAVGVGFSSKVIAIVNTLFWDVLCQRRLFRRSVRRWVIHGLIFFPFLLRFVWGLVALLGTHWLPRSSVVWAMVDKNSPATAFMFDFTGLALLAGIVLAWMRGTNARTNRLPGLPNKDRLALILIGAIVMVGFLLEGLRITLTGAPNAPIYAFFGFAVGRLFEGMTGLDRLYGMVWTLHAVLTGLFIVYLPFSRLMHIIIAPFVLAMGAIGDDH